VLSHQVSIQELVCMLTALANLFALAFYAGRVTQLLRDVAERVSNLETWRNKITG
jgi:hypothetical protein